MTTALAMADEPVTIGVRTVDGRPVGHFPCDETTDLTWSRERSEVSRCEVLTNYVEAGELVPWVHWVDVWEGQLPVWSGPITEAKTSISTGQTRIEARDPAGFMWYTRVPLSRQWSNLDPAPIAADLWRAMYELQRIDIEPEVLPPTIRERFDFSTTADSKKLNATMDDLRRRGLQWTVVAGRPILGIPSLTSVAELDDGDFMAELFRVRSGKRTATDLRVQGKNGAHTERVEMAGLRLQELISIDNMSGLSNITSAARQYLQEVGAIRDYLEVPAGASLHPDAPITTAELIPGYVITVHAGGLAALMRIKSVEISYTGGTKDRRITVDSIAAPVELDPQAGGIL